MKFNIKSFFFVVLLLSAATSFSQLNIDSLSHLNYNDLHNTKLNDVWGYTDENNNEYALVGARKGVSVVDVTNPTAPNEISWTPGSESVWRDIKTFGDYAYVTTEAEDGLLILNLTDLPANTTIPSTSFFGESNEWQTAHNLWIDENGVCYIFGANRGEGGVIMYDVATDPLNPTELGEFDTWYCHDGYVRNDTMYLAHIYEGIISIVDVTDKANPVLLGTKPTNTNFSHNIWLSDDNNYVFTTDEVADSYIGAYDVSDPANIVEVDRIQSNPGTQTIPHNTHVLGDFIITSYYADGVTIHDISDPSNLVEVGNYDTYPGTAASTIGNWGAYPYFASGNIMATDIEYGLFILGPTYKYASKIEGVVTNAVTGAEINDVTVEIENHNQIENSNLIGYYSGGIAATTTRNVTYSKYAFEPKTISTDFVEATTVVQNVELVPINPFTVTINVQDALGVPIFDANVRIENDLISLTNTSDGAGETEFTLYYEVDYDIIVGKWGNITACSSMVLDASTNELTFTLENGIYDDFSFDFGWTTSGTAEAGLFVRQKPVGHGAPGLNTNPYGDSGVDCGKICYVTGNGNTISNVNDYVTQGNVQLTSPVFDLTSFSDPYINYERFWLCRFGPEVPDDTLKVILSNGTDFAFIEKEGPIPTQEGMFVPKSLRVSDYITPTATMQLFVYTENFNTSPNVTEIAFDNFYVSNQSLVGLNTDLLSSDVIVYPNPTSSTLNIKGLEKGETFAIYNTMGTIIYTDVFHTSNTVNVSSFSKGVYMLKSGETTKRFIVE